MCLEDELCVWTVLCELLHDSLHEQRQRSTNVQQCPVRLLGSAVVKWAKLILTRYERLLNLLDRGVSHTVRESMIQENSSRRGTRGKIMTCDVTGHLRSRVGDSPTAPRRGAPHLPKPTDPANGGRRVPRSFPRHPDTRPASPCAAGLAARGRPSAAKGVRPNSTRARAHRREELHRHSGAGD